MMLTGCEDNNKNFRIISNVYWLLTGKIQTGKRPVILCSGPDSIWQLKTIIRS